MHYQKLESRAVTFCYPVPRTLQTLTIKGLHKNLNTLVEAGITVRVEGTQTVLNTWESFYRWAHGRYHMLEDGYDSWIGDDLS